MGDEDEGGVELLYLDEEELPHDELDELGLVELDVVEIVLLGQVE